MGLRFGCMAALLVGAAVTMSQAGSTAKTSITIWGPPQTAVAPAYGGATYGTVTTTTGAMIVEQREIDAASGEIRIAGVPAQIDPASVQMHSLDGSLTVSEQRFVPGATTPDEILSRHVGEAITIQTPKGEVAGTLRSVDAQAIVVEVGTGDQRRLQVMRRDGYVQDIRLANASGGDRPSLVWRVATKKPKQTVELSYRTEGLSWTTDYLAILNDTRLDFSAWATVKNATTATFDSAELVLVDQAQANATRFTVPSSVRLGAGESVQVELFPQRQNAKARSVVVFEAVPDQSASFQQFQAVDCNQLSQTVGTAKSQVSLEVDVPTKDQLPEGKVRLFKRSGGKLDVVSEDPLHSSAGLARINLAPDTDVTGERHAVSCNYDEHAHVIREKIEVKLDNKAKQAADVVVREFLWRWTMSRLEDESPKGTRAGAQTQEYRVRVPAGGHQTITYTVVYSW